MANEKSMSGCVLLEEKNFDWDVFRLQFFDDWKVEVTGECSEEELDFSVNGIEIVCMLKDEQVELAIENAGKNFSWPGARQEIEAHKAHVQLYILECENDLQRHVLFSMISASMLKMPGAIGLYQYPVTRKAADYIQEAERMNKDELPILNWVYIGLYRDQEGLWSSYTYGMEEFSKPDMEILHSPRSLMDVYRFMAETVIYLISNDCILTEGLPLAPEVSNDYKLSLSEGAAIDGDSIKIEI